MGGPWNTFIEGDNLDVLPRLSERVDLVYIDPPYNTGNEFAYRDDFRDDGARNNRSTRHRAWVAMMRPRLEAARAVMSDGAAIFVSIDDNEAAHLRLLMDEVYGERNFLAQVVVNLNPKGRQLGGGFATSHEYLLAYARDARSTVLQASSTETVESGTSRSPRPTAVVSGTCRCATPTRSSTRSPPAPCTSVSGATPRPVGSAPRRSAAASR